MREISENKGEQGKNIHKVGVPIIYQRLSHVFSFLRALRGGVQEEEDTVQSSQAACPHPHNQQRQHKGKLQSEGDWFTRCRANLRD